MKFDLTLISVFFAGFVPILVLGIALTFEKRRLKQIEKPPQDGKLLRPPGYSLSIRLDETFDSIVADIAKACFFCCFAGISVLTLTSILAMKASFKWYAPAAGCFIVFVIPSAWFCLRVFRKFREAQNIRLGLRGEQAVAEALHEAVDCGFRSFHDFLAEDDWNIDHVAVGTRGVFLIETKARRRRSAGNGQASHEVFYDGATLQFPRGKDARPIEQAKRNAKWLSIYLEKKTGDPVRVEPLVVLPGWFVKQSGKGNFPVKVMNANYLVRFLQGQKIEIINPSQVRRIITALDEKCRDLEF